MQAEQQRHFAPDVLDLLKTVEPLTDSPAVVTVRGELYRKPAGKKKAAAALKLLILEVQKKE